MLVVFWAPWSIPCRKYLPTLAGLQKKFPDKLAVVGVTSESEAETADMNEPKPGFASLLDSEAKLGVSVGVTSVPYVMLVDPNGVVRYQGHRPPSPKSRWRACSQKRPSRIRVKSATDEVSNRLGSRVFWSAHVGGEHVVKGQTVSSKRIKP